MVQKLKVNSGMILPTGDDSVPEEATTLHRTASVPTLQTFARTLSGDEIDTPRRAQSVGLSNTMSKENKAVVGCSKPLRGQVYATTLQEVNERPMSAPSSGTITESQPYSDDILGEKKKQGHEKQPAQKPKPKEPQFTPKFLRDCWYEEPKSTESHSKQVEVKSPTFMPKNLRECWSNDDTLGESKKAKELGSPKMQWKAQWAKEKQSTQKPAESICEVCGTMNPLVGLSSCPHGRSSSASSSTTKETNTIDTPQNLVKEKDTKRGKERLISLEMLFQSKQFQNAVSATIKPLLESDDCISKPGVQTKPTNPVELVQFVPVQTVIKGKQQGKATIFHKQPKVPEKKPDTSLKLASLRQSDSTNESVTVGKDSKQDTKHFPRLAPSPTAPLESSGNDSYMTTQHTVQVPTRNVLRVMPNVVIPATVSAVQTLAMSDGSGEAELVASKQHDVQTSASTKSPLLEPVVDTFVPIRSEQEHVVSLEGMHVTSPASATTVVLPAEHSLNVQSAVIPPSNEVIGESIDLTIKQQNSQVSTPNHKQNKAPEGEKQKKSGDKFATPTSIVQPIMQTTTSTMSVVQTVTVQPKSTMSIAGIEPVLSQSDSPSVMKSIVNDNCQNTSSKPKPSAFKGSVSISEKTKSSVESLPVQTSSTPPLQPAVEETIIDHHNHHSPPPLQSNIQTPMEQSRESVVTDIQTTSTESVANVQTLKCTGPVTLVSTVHQNAPATVQEISTPGSRDPKTCENVAEASAVVVPSKIQQHSNMSSAVSNMKLPEGDTLIKNHPVLQPATTAADQPISLVTKPSTNTPEQSTANIVAETTLLPQTQQAPLPKMPSLVPTSITKPQAPPLVLVSSGPPVIKQSSGQRPLLPAPMKLQSASSVIPVSNVTFVTPSTTVQHVVTIKPAAAKETVSDIRLTTDSRYQQQQDHLAESESNKAETNLDLILPLPLENVNRRLKSSTPHIHVPTANGYTRYQKDSNNMREIYRVEVFDDAQPLDLKIASKKKQTISASKVVYLQHSFPCVIRSEVPFVSPQMLQEAFFAAVDYADFNYALQKCAIIHRYMTMQEQGAMSRACVTRTWNGSCKLVPLDEFDSKFEQITSLLEHGEEEEKI